MKIIRALATFICVAFAAMVTFEAPTNAQPGVEKRVGNDFDVETRGVYHDGCGARRGMYQGVRLSTRALRIGTGVGADAAAMKRNCNFYSKGYQETRAAKGGVFHGARLSTRALRIGTGMRAAPQR